MILVSESLNQALWTIHLHFWISKALFGAVEYSGKNYTLVPLVNFKSLIIWEEEPGESGSEVTETREERKV